MTRSLEPQRLALESALDTCLADVLLIVPPFAGIERPAIGPHLLAACAARAGHPVDVLYANVLFAAAIGEKAYYHVTNSPYPLLVGDRVFARAAFGVESVRHLRERYAELDTDHVPATRTRGFGEMLDELPELERTAERFIEMVAEAVAARHKRIIGLTNTFQQLAASHALGRALRRRDPDATLILGGNNCSGEMAEAQHALSDAFDVVFAGECEAAFVGFLDARASGSALPRVVHGEPCRDLDGLPPVDLSRWYEQHELFHPEGTREYLTLLYESSRGCWWGEKHHCTFCGMGETLAWREKSASRVIEELQQLLAAHPNRRVLMTDSILPNTYFKSLLPRMATELERATIFYETKSNLTFARCQLLARAGVDMIQPGIEALSTSLLRRMDKGVTARQNVDLLRFGKMLGLDVTWNLLYGFPGDELAEYEEQLRLLPSLTHLQPPAGPFRLSIDRFSPYHRHPERHGIRGLRPMRGYEGMFPAGTDVARLAYHFDGDFESASRHRPEIIVAMQREVQAWNAAWSTRERPQLGVRRVTEGTFALTDTRAVASQALHLIDVDKLCAALLHGRGASARAREWALAHHIAVVIDGRFTSLATTSAELFAELGAGDASLEPSDGLISLRRPAAPP